MLTFGLLKSGTFITTIIIVSSLVMFPRGSQSDIGFGEPNGRKPVNRRADFTQAEIVLKLLRSSTSDLVAPRIVESVLDSHGTALIIAQQNISRAVTSEQYRTLLLALNREELPDITPVDASERSRRGVEGLRKDVWPALRWARRNTNLLAGRIEEIKRLNLSRRAKGLALHFLPERVELSPRLYIVMGGRAGAAALEGDEIYFDVLAMSYRAANGALQYPTASQIGEYFAHEIHHIGLSKIINRTRRRLRLNDREQRAFSFVTAIILEGSASYLINGHRSLEAMSHDPQFTENLKSGDELLRVSGQILRSVFENDLAGDAYDKATTPFLGTGWHSAGAIMLAAIDRGGGIPAVMKVLRDPRKLLVEYNRAVAKVKSMSGRQTFDTTLARRISSMGM